MEKARTIGLWLLIVSAAAVGAGQTERPDKSVMVMFQDAQYQEQTAGDLDKAIELYQQVMQDAGEVEKLAARATFQLGMCYMKKGDNPKAVEHFKKVVKQYPSQKELAGKASKLLEKLEPEQSDENIFTIVPGSVLNYIGSLYGKTCGEAGLKQLYHNSHITFVDANFVSCHGGYGYYRNNGSKPNQERTYLTGMGGKASQFYDISGRKMNIECVMQREDFHHVYWTPEEPIAPGQLFMYGFAGRTGHKLTKDSANDGYNLTMQNHFGQRVVETFYLVLSGGVGLKESSEPFSGRETVDGYTIYYWTKEVPEGETHKVDITLRSLRDISPEELSELVEDAVLTISTCTETDPKVKKSLESIKGIDPNAVIKELCSYLDSETATVRRSATYILWKGEFSEISAAGDKLIALCGHSENYTRGMAAIALGAGKILAAYDVLVKMTLEDKDGYTRRCGAYALGLFGDQKALPVLEQALKDNEDMVKQNAQAAITMLTKLSAIAAPSKPGKLHAEDLTAEGWKLWQERKLAEAEKKFEEAAAADPSNDGAYQGLGWAQLNQGKKNNAKASFEKCVKLNPQNSAALNGLGWIAHGQNDKDQAIQWWEKAVKAQPGATAALSGLTKTYMEMEQYDKAVHYYEMWLKVEPDNQEAKEGLEKATQLLSEKKQ